VEFVDKRCSGCRMILGWVPNKFGIKVDENWVFGWKMELSQELPQTASSVSCFCVVFICFCFELGFGVNMKVIDNCVSLLMTLVWHQNDLYNLSYGQITARRLQWIFMNFSTTFPEFEMKTGIDRYRIGLWCKHESSR